jgi:hypothetical protein
LAPMPFRVLPPLSMIDMGAAILANSPSRYYAFQIAQASASAAASLESIGPT